MSKRFVAVLVALVLILGSAALYVRKRDESARPAASAQLGRLLLGDLKASDIASIVIREPGRTLTLLRNDKVWTIAERGGFPADLDKVTELVVNSIGLKVGQAEPIGDKDRERLNLIDPGKAEPSGPNNAGQAGLATSLEFKSRDGRILAEILLGKKYFRNEAEADEAKAIGDGRFVLLPTDDRQVFLVSEPYRTASAKSADWVAKDGISIERVKSLEYKPAKGEGYRIERPTDGIDWKLASAPAGSRLDNAKANSAAYSLNKIEIEDVAEGDNDEALDGSSMLKIATFDGMYYTLRIGQMEKDRYRVRIDVEGKPKREFEQRKDEKAEAKADREKSFAEEMKHLEQSVARNQALHGHVLLVAKSKLSDLLKDKKEFLVQRKSDPVRK